MQLPIAGTPSDAGRPIAPELHLLGRTPEQLVSQLEAMGEKKFRAQQILEWIYRRGVDRFEAMSNLSKALRDRLAQDCAVLTSRVANESRSTDGTRKLLLEFGDGAAVETVWIPAEGRHTVCVSSQVGCPVGCRFCASGIDGVQRNLTAGEIVEQAWRVARLVESADSPGNPDGTAAARLSNVVMMGMGEPLANYRAVVEALRILNAPWGMGLGARKITVSTVGLPRQMKMLAAEGLQLNLALSLHATDDGLRRELIPWGKGVPIAQLMDACLHYFRETGREVTFEYVLLRGVNDHPRQAEELARLARQVRANVNLLRYNPVPGLPYERPSSEAAFEFQGVVRARGVNVHIRTSRGKDVAAACGQLRRSATQPPPASAT